ncbi:putative packaging ATPase [Vibrio phage 1.069.O._10N.286.49.F11]|uniref:Putative packaging ATPase n=7 Tax=Autolykiviridae TaxID=2184034 RepID=A0A2I7S890_9VIRU|nr:putative packaging ATPase [Vibrio phage 1.008.O._10N.286.54.E5]AUR81637.1 putative packaging ATPase [Vibrio phage 1.011.O._10N.286.49.B11]AUR83776.1 putative packaging ATPase [Vibrio phage 1.040.O._10N.286.45.B9]AUR84655.1 putative packaging ATPase [Vibrio phage 1.062.O._10N.286.55.C3]AUR85152.1 putative packaging ATPase [Vibrio phage 1.069.O._10N.286.49.F11]AUR89580.1 putative packaging ATPase [Vibrio phage 1.125.O._10N.286.49.F5]AUS02069.1 putative packaging ATPase [Vibrio phage 2.092.O.
MAHSAIVGMTESGKSSLARKMATAIQKAGIAVIVFDPLGDPAWSECLDPNNSFITDNEKEFLNYYWSSKNCAVFFDEAGDYATNHNKEMIRTATKGRHWGHSNYYIAQRGNLLARTIRDQCSKLYMFTSSKDDAKIYSLEFNDNELLNVPDLSQGEYYSCGRFNKAVKHILFKGKSK